MIVDVINTTDKCPPECDDAKITVETMECPFFSESGAKKRVLIDCVHSGVCIYRNDSDGSVGQPERTCHITNMRERRVGGVIEQTYLLSCGHEITKKIGEKFLFCEQCGSRVGRG